MTPPAPGSERPEAERLSDLLGEDSSPEQPQAERLSDLPDENSSPEPPREHNEGRGAMRVLKGCGIAVGVMVGLFIVLLILGAIFGEPRDEDGMKTPAPVSTPVPTATPSPEPAAATIPEPTPAPTRVVSTLTSRQVPTATPVTTLGTGISLAAIQEPFEEAGLLEFRGPAEYGGLKPFRNDAGDLVACWNGESFDPYIRLDLCGTEQDLTNIDLSLQLPFDDTEALVSFMLLVLVFPNEDVPEWVADNAAKALEGDLPSRQYGNLIVTLYADRQGGFTISITWN